MKVSIVTPSFNSAATIEETLRSVLDQQGVELEYLVADGGSRDGTAEIIRRYESRLAWWVSERDGGQVDALNKSFARATGEVLGFLNADDVLAPGALSIVCAAFAKQPEIELVAGGVEWIDTESRVTGAHCGRIESLEDTLDIFRVWWGGRQWVQPEVFYRRSLKQRVGAFDHRYELAFDFDFWLRCFRAGARVAHVPETLVRFRRHAAQKSVDTERANDEIRTVLARHLADGVEVAPWTRWRLRAALSYELFQAGKAGPNGARPAFAAALLRHPSWLLCTPVRRRIREAIGLRPG